MKKLFSILVPVVMTNSFAFAEREPIDKPTAQVIMAHILENGYLKPSDDFKRVGKFFKGAEIYSVWLKNPNGNGSSSGFLAILKQKEKITIFSSAKDAAISLLKSFDGKITNKNELRDLMSVITPITEVEDKGDGIYHVYNGDDFFDIPSGYLVEVKDGKVQSCEYEMKLGEKD